jgi:peptide/nickel transport system substrate-binding protein
MNDNTCGTGPYKLVEYFKDEYAILERNEGWWGGWDNRSNNITKIQATWVPDHATRKLQLMNKELDFVEDLGFEDAEELDKRPDMTTDWAAALATCYYIMSQAPGRPLKDKKLREAITYAFDYEAGKQIFLGHTVQAQGILPRNMFGHNNNLPVYKRDVERAKQALSDAGYKPGELTLSLIYNVYGFKEALANITKANLEEIGINVDIEVTTWPILWEALQNPDAPYDLYIFYQETYYNDPWLFIKSMVWSEAIGAGGTYNKYYINPEVDQLIEKGSSSPDLDVQRDTLMEIQELLMDDYVCIYCYDMVLPKTHWDYIDGYIPDMTQIYIYNIWDWTKRV